MDTRFRINKTTYIIVLVIFLVSMILYFITLKNISIERKFQVLWCYTSYIILLSTIFRLKKDIDIVIYKNIGQASLLIIFSVVIMNTLGFIQNPYKTLISIIVLLIICIIILIRNK